MTQKIQIFFRTHSLISNEIRKLFISLILLGSILILAACEQLPGQNTNAVTATWDQKTNTMSVKGATQLRNTTVQIHDASDGKLLGSATINDDGSWAASSTMPACEVHVEIDAVVVIADVTNAPNDCTSNASPIRNRAINQSDIPANVLLVNNPEPLAAIQNGVILSPTGNTSINVGQVVNFAGAVLDNNNLGPYTYFWNFGGAAPNSGIQRPGAVRFDMPGTYFIELVVTNALGVSDPTPATRTIVVSDSNTLDNLTPIAEIITPTPSGGNIDINVGDSLTFNGSATDSLGSSSFLFEWDFSGAFPSQFGSTTTAIPFNREGNYLISLYATNTQGLRSVDPATITVNVLSSGTSNQAPAGSITAPTQDVAINVGDSLSFSASARDPDNDIPILYSWDFNGVSSNIFLSTDNQTGPITFSTPGIYNITMTATDAKGMDDPNPPVRKITVMDDTPATSNVGILSDTITSPPSSVNIRPGESVFFSAQAPANTTSPSIFFWDFAGGAVNSNLQTPGDVTFSSPGQFPVTLYIVDTAGNLIGTPETVSVTVADPANIKARIRNPRNNTTVAAGEFVELTGSVSNSNNVSSLTYEWKIKRQGDNNPIFTSNQESPGAYLFTQAGDYTISFVARGIDIVTGQTLRDRDRNRITVSNSTAPPASGTPIPGTLNTGILLPTTDVVIFSGAEVDFEANRITGTNISYNWDFNGVRSSSSRRNPSPVQFNTPGTYFIRLQITGSNNGIPINIFEQRVVTVMQQNTAFPPSNPIANNNGISLPVTDAVINVGQEVDFEANRVSGTDVNYLWNFGTARSPSTRRNPSPVQFNQPGTYFVTLQVTGSNNGIPINIFDQRVVTVLQNTTPFPPPVNNPIPPGGNPFINVSGISLPASTVVINVGQEVDCEANRISGTDVTYPWDLSGVRSPSSRRNPPPIQFNTPGTFYINLQVTGSNNGIPINIFNQRVVTVLQQATPFPPGSNPLPPGSNPIAGGPGILLPISDVVINAGQEVDFEANRISGSDVNYQWDFGGARSPSTRRNPSPTQFNSPGTYFVTLQVTGTNNGFPINIFDQRIVTVLTGVTNPQPPTNPFIANSGILLPTTDTVINVGQEVDFEANRIAGTNIQYQWNFGTARSPSTRRNPSPVQFNQPGTYFVTLQVTGSNNGFPINIFDQRVITVMSSAPVFPPPPSPFPPSTTNPIANAGILLPTTSPTINIGQEVDFEANRFNGNVNYLWDFGGAAPQSTRRNPAPIRFSSPGTFTVTLQVTGSNNGIPINIYEQRFVTVLQSFGSVPPTTNPTLPPQNSLAGPEGYIAQPASQLVSIRVGQSVTFSGVGFDPQGTGPLTFQWSFGGARRNIESQNPGPVTFNRVGTFVVTLLVRNAFGQFDTTPDAVLVSVTP